MARRGRTGRKDRRRGDSLDRVLRAGSPAAPRRVAGGLPGARGLPPRRDGSLGRAVRRGQGPARANPDAHICFYGHYAALNGEYLTSHGHADSVLAGELEDALVALARRRADPGPRVSLAKLDFPVPARTALPALKKYAHLDREGAPHLVGY